MVEQAKAVSSRIPVREGLPVSHGVPETPLIPRHHPELGAERLDLGGEHVGVHEEPVGEDDYRSVTPGVGIGNVLPVHFSK